MGEERTRVESAYGIRRQRVYPVTDSELWLIRRQASGMFGSRRIVRLVDSIVAECDFPSGEGTEP